MNVSPSQTDPQPPRAIFCVKCRYNLTSLPIERPCPECGTPITQSLEWLDTVRLMQAQHLTRTGGIVLLVFGIMLYFVAFWLDLIQGINIGLLIGTLTNTIGLYFSSKLPSRWLPSSLTWHFTFIRAWAITIAVSGLVLIVTEFAHHQSRNTTKSHIEPLQFFAWPIFFLAHVLAIVSVIQLSIRIARIRRAHPL